MHELEFSRALDFKTEEFETCFALPRTAKGKLLGVLEAFRRTSFEPDPEWLDFLNTLAAIAIDNVALFDSLQRSNVDLSVAYDATIALWSRAMDLRDREAKGHSQRVTEVRVNLARRFGLRDVELVQVRRGGCCTIWARGVFQTTSCLSRAL